MKLQNAILSGAVKYSRLPVEKMEERITNLKPKTIPPGFTKSSLENYFINQKIYQAVITVFNLTVIDDDGGFGTALDELTAGQFDLIAKQLYFGCFLISWLGCIEEVGRTNLTAGRKNGLQVFSSGMTKFGFPEFDGNDVTEFGNKFITSLNKVPSNTLNNPLFPLYLHDLYSKGLFYVEKLSTIEYRTPTGRIMKIEDPVPFVLEVNNPQAHRPALLQSHPQAYLASFYQLKGNLEKARTTFKAIIEALTNKFEESQPFILQLGYNFEVNIINKNKARVCIKVATTPKNCADPFWENFGLSNADFFDFHQDKESKKQLTDEIEDSDADGGRDDAKSETEKTPKQS